MSDLLASVPWEVYCTWTFRHGVGPDGALREIQRWISLLSWAFSHQLGYMVGLEHDLGAEWCHGHGLLVVLEESLREELTLYAGKRHERTVPLLEPFWLAWHRRHGSGRFHFIEGDGLGCSFYCSKYAAKRGDVIFSTGLETFRRPGGPRAGLTLFPAGGA